MPIVLAAGLFAAVLLIHGIVCRLRLPGSAVMKFVGVGGIGACCLLLTLWRWPTPLPELLGALIVYALLCEFYIFLFTMTIGSISVNLLISLRQQALSDAEVNRLYDSRRMVQSRITRLVSVALLQETEGRLSLTPKGRALARSFNLFRDFFRHPRPERSLDGLG